MGAADDRASNHLLVGLGVGIITTVTGLSIAGTYTAINAMNRQSEEAIAAAKDAIQQNQQNQQNQGNAGDPGNQQGGNQQGGTTVQIPEDPDQAQNPSSGQDPGWMSDQMKWMQENRIHYDEFGLPVDENGNLVDDPTTAVYDPGRQAYFFNEDGTPKNPSVEQPGQSTPEFPDIPGVVNPDVTLPNVPDSSGTIPNPDTADDPITNPDVEHVPQNPAQNNGSPWWLDENGNLLPGLRLDENGRPYYVVVDGDWLSRIANRYGFQYMDLARESGIRNPDLIYAGDIIRFPDVDGDDPGHAGSGGTTAPGRG